MSLSGLQEEPAHRPRSSTKPWQRTVVKDRFRALRESLAPHERMLLVLRVDRRLPWMEVARVMADPDEPMTAEALARRAAALRQQFQRIKDHLRALAAQEGLLASDSRQ
jgi:RNA polymerase sigma-70 factor (ECF subfamily)